MILALGGNRRSWVAEIGMLMACAISPAIRNDARGIAQMMRLGWFRAVHVKDIEMQRTLLSNRKLLKRKLVDIENHIRGALRT